MLGGTVVPTEAQVAEALEANGIQTETGKWFFGNPGYPHSQQAAESIVRICLILETEVTDLGTSDLFLAMVNRIVALEERVSALE